MLGDGRVIEHGPPEELIRTPSSLFARMIQAQQTVTQTQSR